MLAVQAKNKNSLQVAMALFLGRQLLFLVLILLLQLCLNCEGRPKESQSENDDQNTDDDNDTSSEETVEDSSEKQRRRRDLSNNNSPTGRAGIPGLPDPATIIKIAQLFQSVGEQIVPILVEAILPSGNDATGDRFSRDLQLLKSVKRSLELYSDELQKNID